MRKWWGGVGLPLLPLPAQSSPLPACPQIGAALYATRFPERYKPGAFDVAFHSHQLFHVAVVVAACIHYKAVHILLVWRDASGGCPPPLVAGGLGATGTAFT